MPTVDVTLGVNVRNDNQVVMTVPASKTSLTVDSNIRSQGVQNISTSAEAVAIGDVTLAGGYARFKNLDDANFVEIGLMVSAVFVPFVTLSPGSPPASFNFADKDLFAKFDTAAGDLEYLITDGPTP